MSVKKKTSALKVQKPVVSNTIDMHLTHNDVIDVAVEEQKERLENEIKGLEEQMKLIKEEFEVTKESLVKEGTKESTNDELYQLFLKKYPQSVITSENTSRISNKEAGTYKCFSRNIEGYKTLIAVMNNCVSAVHMEKRSFSKLVVTISESSDYYSGNRLILNLDISDSIQKIYSSAEDKYIKTTIKLGNKLFDTQCELAEYTHNEKRIRSKFVKTALRATNEGNVFLELLETSTKIKLIG